MGKGSENFKQKNLRTLLVLVKYMECYNIEQILEQFDITTGGRAQFLEKDESHILSKAPRVYGLSSVVLRFCFFGSVVKGTQE